MSSQFLTFRELIDPVDPELFLDEYYGKKPLHIPGAADKFAKLFSWHQLNDLLAMSTLWTDRSFELAKNGRNLPAEAFCYPSVNREGGRALKPNLLKVRQLLSEGATLALDFIELLQPELRSVAQTLEAVLGAQVCASMFCSWRETQGYASHFDTQNVFACHIEGTKTWRLYEGRMANAADLPGGHRASFPQEQHERMKGRVAAEVAMSPGDLLYIPHGFYHDALSSSEAALHVSFGSIHLVAHDFLQALMKDLPKDPAFRAHLPHLDDQAGQEAYLQDLAGRLQAVIAQPVIAQQLRDFMRQGAFERMAAFALPERGDALRFRVRWHGRRIEEHDGKPHLMGDNQSLVLSPAEAEIGRWLLSRDLVDDSEIAAAVPQIAAPEREAAMSRFEQAALIERL